MNDFRPHALTPRDGWSWLREALMIMAARPPLFLAAALLAPAGSILLLSLPLWDATFPVTGGWLPVVATVVCYGLPVSLAVSVASGYARAADRQRPPPPRQLLVPAVLRVLARTGLFLCALLLQGYLAVYLVKDLITPGALNLALGDGVPAGRLFFELPDTILGTQLNMIGALLLVFQVLFAGFVAPLHLFREIPLFACWRLSFRAMQLNPWLGPALGLPGLGLILLSSFEVFSVLAQVLALPLPAYLGALLYVGWKHVFQGGVADEAELSGRAPT